MLLDREWSEFEGRSLLGHVTITGCLSLSLATGVPQPAHLLLLPDSAAAVGRGGGAGRLQAVALPGDTESSTQ